MALYVNTNISALRGQSNLAKVGSQSTVAYQRLSSGLRINTAKDDAAGLRISNRLSTQINGLEQGNRNTTDAISLLQTADGALDEYIGTLQRIRELAVQSASDIYSDDDRVAMQVEATALSHELTRIAKNTTFAGAQILDGAGKTPETSGLVQPALVNRKPNPHAGITFQIGADAGQEITIDLSQGFSDKAMYSKAFFNSNDLGNIPHQMLTADGKPDSFPKDKLREKHTGYVFTYQGGVFATAVGRFVVSSSEFAEDAIGTVDKFLEYATSQRTEIGSVINRLETSLRTQSDTNVNQSDVRSRIRDADFAKETAHMTQTDILQAASQSILAQANQRPNLAVMLLH